MPRNEAEADHDADDNEQYDADNNDYDADDYDNADDYDDNADDYDNANGAARQRRHHTQRLRQLS